MAKKVAKDYLLLFRGGRSPDEMSPEEMKATMNSWMKWMKDLEKRRQLGLGHPLQDGGKLLAGAKGEKVTPLRITRDTIGGYMMIKASNLTEATKISKGCPIFHNGGTVELRPIEPMPGG